MEDAMNARDIDSILEGVAKNVVFTTMNGDVVIGREGLRDYFDTMMTGPEARVKEVETHFEVDELTTLYNGFDASDQARFGIAYGHSNDRYVLADGTEFEVKPRWSAALVRDPQGWKIANFHYSVNMFDNPVVHKMKGTLTLVGLGGLVVGLLLGFFVGRRRPS
jgi:ketosteroid isomerase-like protein